MQSTITGKNRWNGDVIEAASFRFGANGIRVELRFSSRADADGLLARVETFATGVRLPVAGSWVRIHNCNHDEGGNACVVDAEKVW